MAEQRNCPFENNYCDIDCSEDVGSKKEKVWLIIGFWATNGLYIACVYFEYTVYSIANKAVAWIDEVEFREVRNTHL